MSSRVIRATQRNQIGEWGERGREREKIKLLNTKDPPPNNYIKVSEGR